MPNWCDNSLVIFNPKVFKEKCVKDGVFRFENIIPMPEHLKFCSHVLCMTESEEKYLNDIGITPETLKEKLPNEFFTNSRIADFLMAKSWFDSEEKRTGVNKYDWYNWDCGNYGTKWDLSDDDADLSELDEVIEIGENETFELNFATAWSPPIPVLEKMAELGVIFDWHCEEGGCGIFMEGSSNGESFSYCDCGVPEGYYDEDEQP